MPEKVKNKKEISRFSAALRIMSSVLVIAFLLETVAQAEGGTPLWSQVSRSEEAPAADSSISSKYPRVHIPKDSGITHRALSGGSDELLINIQDAHSKLGAQESISNILGNLVKNYQLDLVALEGASETIDTSLISSFPDKSVREKTGQYLLGEGKISAGEFYSMVSGGSIRLYGAEDPELYQENLEVFKVLIGEKAVLQRELTALKKILTDLQSKVYSEALQEMLKRKLMHKNGEIELEAYWKYFSQVAREKEIRYEGYPNFKKLISAAEMEKNIDFKSASRERDVLLQGLSVKLDKAGLEQVLLKTLEFKQNKITPGAFHYFLCKTAEKAGMDPAKDPNLILYSQYLLLYESIDLVAIFGEIESFESEAEKKFFRNEDERSLSDLTGRAKILSRLLDTTLSSKDYEFYLSHQETCEVSRIREGLETLGSKYGVTFGDKVDFEKLAASVAPAKKFYELASRRNQTLLSNTLKKMRAEKVHVAALVTGGFHSEGISRLMEEDRLSYLVVMPKFDEQSPDRPYIAVITKQPKEYEEQFKDSDFYIAAASYMGLSNKFNQLVHGEGSIFGEDLEEFPAVSFAAILGAYRINGFGSDLAPSVQKEFYENVKKAQEGQGGGIIPLDRLESWLRTAKISVKGDFYGVTFKDPDGAPRSFRIYHKNQTIQKIEVWQDAGAIRPVAEPVVSLIRGEMSAAAGRAEYFQDAEFEAAAEEIAGKVIVRFQVQFENSGKSPPSSLEERIAWFDRQVADSADKYARVKSKDWTESQKGVLAVLGARLESRRAEIPRASVKEEARLTVQGARLSALQVYFESLNKFISSAYEEADQAAKTRTRLFISKVLKTSQGHLLKEIRDVNNSWFRFFLKEKKARLQERLTQLNVQIIDFENRIDSDKGPEGAEGLAVWASARAKALRAILGDEGSQKNNQAALRLFLEELALLEKESNAKILKSVHQEVLSKQRKKALPEQIDLLKRIVPMPFSEPTPKQMLEDIAGILLELQLRPPSEADLKKEIAALEKELVDSAKEAVNANTSAEFEAASARVDAALAALKAKGADEKRYYKIEIARLNKHIQLIFQETQVSGATLEAIEKLLADLAKIGERFKQMGAGLTRAYQDAATSLRDYKLGILDKALQAAEKRVEAALTLEDFDSAKKDYDAAANDLEGAFGPQSFIADARVAFATKREVLEKERAAKIKSLREDLAREEQAAVKAKNPVDLNAAKARFENAAQEFLAIPGSDAAAVEEARKKISSAEKIFERLIALEGEMVRQGRKAMQATTYSEFTALEEKFYSLLDQLKAERVQEARYQRSQIELLVKRSKLILAAVAGEVSVADLEAFQRDLDASAKKQSAATLGALAEYQKAQRALHDALFSALVEELEKMEAKALASQDLSDFKVYAGAFLAAAAKFEIVSRNGEQSFVTEAKNRLNAKQKALENPPLSFTRPVFLLIKQASSDPDTAKRFSIPRTFSSLISRILQSRTVEGFEGFYPEFRKVSAELISKGAPIEWFRKLRIELAEKKLFLLADRILISKTVDEMRPYVRDFNFISRQLQAQREKEASIQKLVAVTQKHIGRIKNKNKPVVVPTIAEVADEARQGMADQKARLLALAKRMGMSADETIVGLSDDDDNTVVMRREAKKGQRAAQDALNALEKLRRKMAAETSKTSGARLAMSPEQKMSAVTSAMSILNKAEKIFSEVPLLTDRAKIQTSFKELAQLIRETQELLVVFDPETRRADKDVQELAGILENTLRQMRTSAISIRDMLKPAPTPAPVSTATSAPAPTPLPGPPPVSPSAPPVASTVPVPAPAASTSAPTTSPASAVTEESREPGRVLSGLMWTARQWKKIAILAILIVAFRVVPNSLMDKTSKDAPSESKALPSMSALPMAPLPLPDGINAPGVKAVQVPASAMNPGQAWLRQRDKIQGLKADMLNFSLRTRANIAPGANYLAEIPQLARDQEGLPIATQSFGGQAFLVYADGTTIAVTHPVLQQQFKQTGRFYNDPAHPFRIANLNNLEFVDVNIGGVPVPMPRFNGGVVPVGIDGKQIPVQPIFFTQPAAKDLVLGIRDKTGQAVSKIPTGASDSDYSHYNAATGNPVIFLDPRVGLTKAEGGMATLQKRIELIRELELRPNILAVEVDNGFNIKARILKAEDVPLRFIYPRKADGSLGVPYYSDDITQPAPPEGSVHRVAVKQPAGNFLPGNEIVFNPFNEQEKLIAQANFRDTLYRAMGTWSASSPITSAEERVKTIRPIYAIVVKGSEAIGVQEYYEIPALSVLAGGLPNTQMMERFGVNPNVLKIIALQNQPVVNVLDGKATELELGNGYTLLTSNSPRFERFMLLQDKKLRENDSVMATQYAADGVTVTRIFKYESKKDVDDLVKLTPKKLDPTQRGFYTKDAGKSIFIERNLNQNILAVQVSPDLRTRSRVFWSHIPADVQELARLRALPGQKNNNAFGFQVNEPVNPKTNNSWIFKACFGYELDKDGKLTIYDSFIGMRDRLRVKQVDGTERAYRLQYVLADGQVVPWYFLRETDIVVEIRDPETQSRIFTGSEYLRLTYELGAMPMVEKINRRVNQRVEHYFSKVLVQEFRRFGMTFSSYNPYDEKAAYKTIEEYRQYLGRLQKEVEAREDLPEAVKIRMVAQLETLAYHIGQTNAIVANNIVMIVESSTREMLIWREKKLDALQRQMNYESVLASGGTIVSSNGTPYIFHSVLLQMNQSWGGDRVTLAFPDWVGNDKEDQKVFKKVIQEMLRAEEKALVAHPPVTLFRVHDPAAVKPVVETALDEYRAYLEAVRKELIVAEKDYQVAAGNIAGKKGKEREAALRETFQAGIRVEFLARILLDSERPDDPAGKRKLIYIRPADVADPKEKVMVAKVPDKNVQVVIVPTPYTSKDVLIAAEALWKTRVKNAQDTALALERGGMLVSVPSDPVTSRVLVRDPVPAKNPAEIAKWEAVIAQKSLRLEALRNQWLLLLQQGKDVRAVAAEMAVLQKEFSDNTFQYRDMAGDFGPAGVPYIVEFLGGTAQAKAEIEKNKGIVDMAKDTWRIDHGGAVIRLRGGVPTIETAPALVAVAQNRLSEKLKDIREEYTKLCVDQTANPSQPGDPGNHPRRIRDNRIQEIAYLLRVGDRYEEGADTFIVIGGFRGAEHELIQSLHGDLGPNQELYIQRDALGVPTGVSVVWQWDGAQWKREKVYEPYSVDTFGRRRVKVTDLRTQQVYIETFDLISVTQAGISYRQTRPLQRDVLVNSYTIKTPGRPDRVLENWTRTIHHDYLPNTITATRSTTTAYTKEGDVITEGSVVAERSLKRIRNGPFMGQPVMVDGAIVYDVKYGPGAGDQKGLRRMVGLNPANGDERMVFYPELLNAGTVAVKINAEQYDKRLYTENPATGELTLGVKDKEIRDTGRSMNGGKVFVELDRSGRFERAYAADTNGTEVASFYPRPQMVNGTPVKGIVILRGNQTAALLDPAVRTARGYSENLPIKQTFYYDANYQLIDRSGRPVPAGAMTSSAAGYVVQAENHFSNYPAEYYSEIPRDWKVNDEIAPNGDFIQARVVNERGNEVANIRKFPNGQYAVEFISPDPAASVAKGEPVRVTYGAEYANGIYTVSSKAISTTHKHQMVAVQSHDADKLIDGDPALGKNHPLNLISKNIGASQKTAAKNYLHASLTQLRKDLAIDGPLNIDVTAVQMSEGGTSFAVRVKGYIVLFSSSDSEASVLINTRWNTENGLESGIEGYEFSRGLLFHVKADPVVISSSQFVGQKRLTDAQKAYYDVKKLPYPRPLAADRVAELQANGVQIDDQTLLSRVTRSLKVNGTEIISDIKWIRTGDPFMRPFAVQNQAEDTGHTRFMKGGTSSSTVSPGEVVLDTLRGEISRNTVFREHDASRSEYIYEVLQTGKLSDQRNPGLIVYNYRTHTVYEVYGVFLKEGKVAAGNTPYPYVLVSRDGFFLYTYNFKDTDYKERAKGGPKLYSEFRTTVWLDHNGKYGAKGDIFMLLAEEIKSPEVRGQGESAYLFRNGKLYASGKGLIINKDGTEEIFTVNPANPTDTDFRGFLKERFDNSLLGHAAGMTGATNREELKALCIEIKGEGTTVSPDFPETRPQEISRDWRLWMVNNAWWMGLSALLALIGYPLYKRFTRKSEKERTQNGTSRLDRDVFGARLATGMTPEMRFLMAHELKTGLLLGPHIPESKRAETIRNHYKNNLGFSPDEADRLVKADAKSRSPRNTFFKDLGLGKNLVSFDDDLTNYYEHLEAMPISPATILANVAQGVVSRYPPALIIYELKNQDLVSNAEIEAAVLQASAGGKRRGDLLWRTTYEILLGIAQNRVLSGPITRDLVNKLPATRSAIVLKYILNNDLIPIADIRALAATHKDFGSFVEDLIAQKVIQPVFDEILSRTLDGEITPRAKADLLRVVKAEILTVIYHNPTLLDALNQPVETRDFTHMPYPISRSVESTTLRESILTRMLDRSPSETKGHSIGMFAATWPYKIYLMRRINELLLAGGTQADVLKLIDDMNGAFLVTIKREVDRYKLITGRDQWRTVEGHAIALVQKALKDRTRPLPAIMTDVKKALLGRPELIAAHVESFLNTDINYSEEEILTFVEKELERLALVDLFMELDLHDIFQFTMRQAEEARKNSQPVLSIEEQVARHTGRPVRTLAELAQTAKTGTDDQKTALAMDFKKTTLSLMGEYHPEAVKADRETKRPASLRKIPFFGGWGAVIFGAVSLFTGFVGVYVAVSLIALGIALLISSYRPAGLGLGALYFGRMLKPLFSLDKFWGMRPAEKVGFYLSSLALVTGGVAIIVMAPKLLALGVFLILLAPMLMPIVWSNMSFKQKLIWGFSVVGGSTFYVGAILVFFLFSGVTFPAIFTLGFVFTALLVILTYPVTIISFHHLTTSARSYLALGDELWSDTERSLIGWRSLNPFRGFVGDFFSTRVPKSEGFAKVMKIALPVSLVAGIFLGSLFWGVVILTVLAVVGHLAISFSPRWDIPEFWENFYEKGFAEFQWVEEHRRSPIPNGESVAEYMERTIKILHKRFLLSSEEAQMWLDAVNGKADGRFVRPRSSKAHEVLKLVFFAVSQKKVVPDPWELLQASSTHVQAAGEMFTHTVENCILLGTFNDNSSLMGYVARTHEEEWENLVDRLGRGTTDNIRRFTIRLRGVNERTNFVALMNSAALTKKEKEYIYQQMINWMNEMRPNNDAVMESMAQDHKEYHILLSFESGDIRYRDAVRVIGSDYVSLSEAFRILSLKKPADLKPAEAVFLAGYEKYQKRVDLKLRGIFQDASLWNNFRAETGGKNITKISPLDNLLTTLEKYRDALPAADPIRAEVIRIIGELNQFHPTRSAAGDRAKFATMEQWSREFLAWRKANMDQWVFLVQKMGSGPDKIVVPSINVGGVEQRPREFMNTLVQAAETVMKAGQVNIEYAFHDFAKDNFLDNAPGKHQGIALNLKSFFGTTVDYDAHVMNEHGQHIFRTTWASMNSRLRNPHIAAINPMMVIWSSLKGFPATMLYAIAQTVWTSDVQRAFREYLLDYGKYMGIPQTIGPFFPPGEDSMQILMLQLLVVGYGALFYIGTQIDWFIYRWARPPQHAESLVTTETRYPMNVTRFLMDRSSFAIMYNPNIPASVKLTHLFLWAHYFIAPAAVVLLIVLPFISPFSAFAFLKPLLFFVLSSYILMEAINTNNFVRHWRETGSFWEAMYYMMRDVTLALPFYVSLIPFFLRGIWLASNEIFSFMRTVKEAFLGSWDERQRYEELMLFKFLDERGIPLNNYISIMGITSYLVGLVTMTPLAPALLMPYLLTAISFTTGIAVIDVFKDRRNGLLYGYSFWAMFTRFPAVMKRMVFHLWHANPKSEKAAKDRAKKAGLQPSELGEVRPSTFKELIGNRKTALERAGEIGAKMRVPAASWPDFRSKTTLEINQWSAVKEIEKQVDDGARMHMAAARLAQKPKTQEGKPFSTPTSNTTYSNRISPLPQRIVVGISDKADPDRPGKNIAGTARLVEATAFLESRPELRYQVNVVRVKDVSAFAATTRSPFNIILDSEALDSPHQLTQNMQTVLSRRNESIRQKIQRTREEKIQTRKLLGVFLKVVHSAKGDDADLSALESQITAQMRRNLRRIQLPEARPVTLIYEGERLKTTSINDTFSLSDPRAGDRGSVNDAFDRALRRMSQKEAPALFAKAAFDSSRFIYGGDEYAFDQRIGDYAKEIITAYKKALASENDLIDKIPPANLNDTVVLLTHTSLLEGKGEEYLAQLRRLDEQVKALNEKGIETGRFKVRHVLLVTDPSYRLSEHPDAAAYFGESEVLTEPDLSLAEIQKKYSDLFGNPSVILAREGVLDKKISSGKASQPLVLYFDSKARTFQGMPQTGIRLAISHGDVIGIPGLEKLANGVFKWLPALQRLEGVLREAVISLRSTSVSA